MRMKTLLFAIVLIAAVALPGGAQEACPCVPLGYTWLATACDSWNCAASALVMANGDPYLFAVPTASTTHRWVVVRRVVSGTAAASDDTFALERFSGMGEASARYSSLQTSAAPMMVTANDGAVLVIYLRGSDTASPPPPSPTR